MTRKWFQFRRRPYTTDNKAREMARRVRQRLRIEAKRAARLLPRWQREAAE